MRICVPAVLVLAAATLVAPPAAAQSPSAPPPTSAWTQAIDASGAAFPADDWEVTAVSGWDGGFAVLADIPGGVPIWTSPDGLVWTSAAPNDALPAFHDGGIIRS